MTKSPVRATFHQMEVHPVPLMELQVGTEMAMESPVQRTEHQRAMELPVETLMVLGGMEVLPAQLMEHLVETEMASGADQVRLTAPPVEMVKATKNPAPLTELLTETVAVMEMEDLVLVTALLMETASEVAMVNLVPLMVLLMEMVLATKGANQALPMVLPVEMALATETANLVLLTELPMATVSSLILILLKKCMEF